jgi:hypothetical protein
LFAGAAAGAQTRAVEPGRGASAEAVEAEFSRQLALLEQFRHAVQAANEPVDLTEETARVLAEIASHTFERADGTVAPYLEPNELHYLRIPHGSLDEHERREVETHAEQTYEFLSSIAWTEDLKDIADYASGHHEKLDGSGYPRHLRASALPVQTRIMAIADIFDALTAADRPYKTATTPARAHDKHQAETKGRLESDLVRVMIDSRVYRRILEEDWRCF